MAKKKAKAAVKKTAKTKKAAPKKAAPKKATAKAAKKKTSGGAKTPAKKKAATKAAPGKKAKEGPSLGRPLVTGEEKLFLLFKEDYHARQVVDFLRVETVKDLEQFSPQEIVHRLSQPVRQTVEGIRRRLAEKNRCLAGDEEYVLKHRAQNQ
jgi:hypothetical protein